MHELLDSIWLHVHQGRAHTAKFQSPKSQLPNLLWKNLLKYDPHLHIDYSIMLPFAVALMLMVQSL
jgi:hypothetical protein